MRYAIFGYGSLVNKSSLASTLGRKIDHLYPTILEGWVRDWSIIIKNDEGDKYFALELSNERPSSVAVLNIRKATGKFPATNPNGVLCGCSIKEIEQLDAREVHYKRIDVTQFISNTHGFDKIFTYVGEDKYLANSKTKSVTPSSYIDIVRDGFLDFGEEFYDLYKTSTIPSPYKEVNTKFIIT